MQNSKITESQSDQWENIKNMGCYPKIVKEQEINPHNYFSAQEILKQSLYTYEDQTEKNQPSAPPMAQNNDYDILNFQPQQWLPDSFAPNCGLCQNQFQLILRQRHHCRFCGRVFCNECCFQKLLLPINFNQTIPQKVCNQCYEILMPYQQYLAETISQSTKMQIFDALDSSTPKSWLNLPYSWDFNYEIYKCTNVIKNFCIQNPEFQQLINQNEIQGLLIMSCVKLSSAGTFCVGSGLLIRKKNQNEWSPPCAVKSIKIGVGLKFGLETINLILCIKTKKDLEKFCCPIELGLEACESISGNLFSKQQNSSIILSIPSTSSYKSYNQNKGISIGLSFEGILLVPRKQLNFCFYGLNYSPQQILFDDNIKQPKACQGLYKSLNNFIGLNDNDEKESQDLLC